MVVKGISFWIIDTEGFVASSFTSGTHNFDVDNVTFVGGETVVPERDVSCVIMCM